MFLRRERRTAVGITVTLCIVFIRLAFWMFGEWLDDQNNRNYDLDLTPRAPTSQYKDDVLTLLAPNIPTLNLESTQSISQTNSRDQIGTIDAEFQQTLDTQIFATSTLHATSRPISSP